MSKTVDIFAYIAYTEIVDGTVYKTGRLKGGEACMNLIKLAEKIENCGLTKSAIAEGLGLTRQGLYNKLSGDNEFTGSELKTLSKLLELTDQERNDIFFADDVDKSPTST